MEPWEERLVREYGELSERAGKLRRMLENWCELDFEPKCSFNLLSDQLEAMERYMRILRVRAMVEEIPILGAKEETCG